MGTKPTIILNGQDEVALRKLKKKNLSDRVEKVNKNGAK